MAKDYLTQLIVLLTILKMKNRNKKWKSLKSPLERVVLFPRTTLIKSY